MIVLGCSNEQTSNIFYKSSNNNEVLSSIIVNAWCTSSFLDHFREANEQ